MPNKKRLLFLFDETAAPSLGTEWRATQPALSTLPAMRTSVDVCVHAQQGITRVQGKITLSVLTPSVKFHHI